MDLHREVLAPAERAADATERQSHRLGREAEALRHLVAVDVQPLRRDVQLDATGAVRHRQARLGAEERLVLHPDLVGPLHDDRGRRRGIAALDVDAAQHVAALVQGRGERRHRLLGVADGVEHLELDGDQVRGLARGLGVVGGDDRDRLALEAHVAPRQHGLVGELEPVGLAARHVGVREHGAHARQRGGGARVERQDQCARVRAAQRRAPEHPLHAHVRRVLELAAHLRDPVRALRAGSDAAGGLPRARGGGGRRHAASRPAASWTASMIFA